MGRKSLKGERIQEILAAFETCLEIKGLQATTLDDIANEAGMARRMVRHYIGNREDVVNAGVEHIINKFKLIAAEVLSNSNTEERFNTALDFIFSEQFNDHPSTKHVAALLPVSLYNEDVCGAVKRIYDYFLDTLKSEIKTHKPDAAPESIQLAAYSVMSLSFGGGWMRNIGFDHKLNDQNKNIAKEIINAL